MKENINIAEILKDAPKGTKLWSPLCGECYFLGVELTSPIIVEVKDENNNNHKLYFAANGKFFSKFTLGECMLFPSKDNRDWSTFKAPWKHKHFEPFQKVLIPGIIDNVYYWSANFYSHYDKKHRVHYLIDGETIKDEDRIISYEGNEDKLSKQVE